MWITLCQEGNTRKIVSLFQDENFFAILQSTWKKVSSFRKSNASESMGFKLVWIIMEGKLY
jgi:hypothetical protein